MAGFPSPEKETPLAATSGASRDSFAGLSQHPSSLALQRAQFLTLAYSIRPDVAVMLGALVFDGGAQ
jgi:hypothetical protein